MKVITDGNGACSNVAYFFSEVASIYPITPSSPMASNLEDLKNTDRLNMFGAKPLVYEMQSEAGAAGTMHGALLTGSLTSTFTASQGLLLMIPNMYKMAGEMLPSVIHVAARSLATHSLSIFGDHQDIYAARSTGFCFLASTNVFDAQNLAAVAHLSSIDGSLPFLHFFDGFRTSHELNTIDKISDEDLMSLVDKSKINEYKNRCMSDKKQFGMAENGDIYFQNMETRNTYYNNMPDIVNKYMTKINGIMNTDYKPFNYFGSKYATNVIVAMGSVCDTIKEVISLSNKSIGLIEVHLYRPFSTKYFMDVLPKSVRNIAVLDRTKEAGSTGEPLYLDVVSILNNKGINIVGGRYGLSSKNVTCNDIYDVYNMLETNPKHNFVVGICDDVTNLSIEHVDKKFIDETSSIKIFGFGSDGMVSASKDIIKLSHKKDNLFVQGYFEYDSKKSGGVTVSNLRFSDKVINKPYFVEKANLVVVTKDEYFDKYDIVDSINKDGILLINTNKSEDEINGYLNNQVKEFIRSNNIKVYTVDAESIAIKNNLNGKINKIIEVIIFKLLNKDYEDVMIESIEKVFKTKGKDVINNNINALKDAKNNYIEISIDDTLTKDKYISSDVIDMINSRCGDLLKVSDLMDYKDGSFESGNTKNENRKVSNYAPVWNKENCIECGMCSMVCPHAVIRPFVGDFDEGKPYMMDKGKKYVIKISKEDCTACGLCVGVCPGLNGNKALSMEKIEEYDNQKEFFDHKNEVSLPKFTIKGSQFLKPRFEFSGACAGCGETAYIKLLTQLYGDNIFVANATGCSSIYGGSAPSTPYSIPWANSLFEDNAEFALGMHLSISQKRNHLKNIIEEEMDKFNEPMQKLFTKLLDNFDNDDITNDISDSLKDVLLTEKLEEYKEYIPSKTVWAVGGDGWAYDIGYGGLDHILHSNLNINVLVLDTEVYSNTGGQASKSTKLGAVAEFANMGKQSNKKDLFKIAMSIPNCYVASIALGANMMQTLKAFKEAKEHNGPSIIIAYSPCIEHGIKSGLANSIDEQKLAVESGYTLLMRYNPIDRKLSMDSNNIDFDLYNKFLTNETRFKSLLIKDKELAENLFNLQKETPWEIGA